MQRDLASLTRNRLQLTGVAAMLVASKYEEIYAPEVRVFFGIVNPHWFNADSDTAFFLIADPDPDPMRIRIRIQFQIRGFDSQKLEKKFVAGIFIYIFDQNLQFTYP
jgi:hypothetical protein